MKNLTLCKIQFHEERKINNDYHISIETYLRNSLLGEHLIYKVDQTGILVDINENPIIFLETLRRHHTNLYGRLICDCTLSENKNPSEEEEAWFDKRIKSRCEPFLNLKVGEKIVSKLQNSRFLLYRFH
ncbi:hypothetical protein [Pseudoalteromonas sp. NGC95]|uniref:hypothetical protein n=1 Tax=Pseudoalteromonas sp. NGC95 TaxID=2792051 RepID=UPI0018CE96E2|nr:hypothetical protein [Pseudoalteromonas sp. NGC95]MBH0018739.1 hypothetical protein [Pseudoalteromonas sp. NGC95]